jgi:hypothetical protein
LRSPRVTAPRSGQSARHGEEEMMEVEEEERMMLEEGF